MYIILKFLEMFLPLFIAILLGFTTPSDTNYSNDSTVVVTSTTGEQTQPNGTPEDNPGGDLGGDTGQTPPPKKF
jgi:hypothetical protein